MLSSKLLSQPSKLGLLVLLTGLLLLFDNGYAQKAEISETRMSIKTYPYGDPSPVPTLAQGSERIYPYFKFDRYSRTGRDQKWKVVTLENKYIQVFILPEVGGKVWGAIEKSTGKEFLYRNEVMKFRNIAMRGPWTSGGIEFNFGIIGHTPTTATPVDYRLRENDDGSVSCIIGALDLPSRTEWRVTITLPADRAYFKTESAWFNPTPLDQPYYVWMNAAIKAADDLQFFFPGTHYIGHSGNEHPWPIDSEGRNLSYYRNNDFGPSKSYHVLGKRTEYFGGYWHDEEFGFGHWAHYNDMPGKKIWIWSLSRSGAIWEDLLTDTDGQYVEVQSGRLFNQASSGSSRTPFDQTSFHASASDRWSELWFPVKNTGGLATASPHAVLELEQTDEGATLKLMALQSFSDELKITTGGRRISNNRVSLEPLQVYTAGLELSNKELEELKIVLGDQKLVYDRSRELELERPLESQLSGSRESTAETLYRQAQNEANLRNFESALELYTASLKQDRSFLPAHVGLSELYFRRGEYQESIRHAEHALSIDTYHGGANYIYGESKARTGDTIEALEALGWAARSLKYRSAAYGAMAGIYLKQQDYGRSIEYAKRALDYNQKNLNALKTLAVSHRKQGNTAPARTTLDQIYASDPLNHFAHFEQYLLESTDNRLEQFTSLVRNELPHETYLELGIYYARHNLNDEAIQVLEQAPENPIVRYWLGYLTRGEAGGQSRQHLDRAISISSRLVYPFRLETIPVLEWAKRQNDSWKNDYYLGLIYWHAGRKEEASRIYTRLNDTPDYAPFYLTRGKLQEELGGPDQEVLQDYRTANRMAPDEWRTWHALTEFHIRTGALGRALNSSEQAYRKFPDNDAIEMDYAKSLLYNGEYRDCIALLDGMHILPFEGASEGHRIFEKANLFFAVELIRNGQYQDALRYLEQSKKWPENLGVGRPYDPDVRLQQFLQAHLYGRMGKDQQSDRLLNRIVDYTQENTRYRGSGTYIAILALQRLGETDRAQTMLAEWKNAQPDDPLVEPAAARIEGNRDRARTLESRIIKNITEPASSTVLMLKALHSTDGGRDS